MSARPQKFVVFVALAIMVLAACLGKPSTAETEVSPDFQREVLPIFRKHCIGCHNRRDAEGGLILEDYEHTLRGGEHGAVIKAGEPNVSKLWRMMNGELEPVMPPPDQPRRPTEGQLSVVRRWIELGAKPPAKTEPATGRVRPPTAEPPQTGNSRGPKSSPAEPIVALIEPAGVIWTAIARPRGITIHSKQGGKPLAELTGHAGSITDVTLSTQGDVLCVAAGEPGLYGEVTLWRTADWSREGAITGHRDALYSAQLSPDGKTIATASYDREIHLWSRESGKRIASCLGHNEPVYAVRFHPQGQLLLSASGDRTIKLWDIATGARLDTLSQPAKEQYALAAHPHQPVFAAGGVDCRVRVWEITSAGREGTNPILYARFAHEAPILQLAYSPDGSLLVSASEDRRVKVWETTTYTEVAELERQLDWPTALAFSGDGRGLSVGCANGRITHYSVQPWWIKSAPLNTPLNEVIDEPLSSAMPAPDPIAEVEPNGELGQAMSLTLPATVRGELRSMNGIGEDVDLYQAEFQATDAWVIETNAARSGSSADTSLDILDQQGKPVLRGQLQAVRDSWIEFRPIDSSSNDVRLQYWEEMDLNQYVYMNGEVCKTFRAPQGPDSGFQLYRSNGRRRCYFDTSAKAHAKDEPAYIVTPYGPQAKLIDNGLPIFPLYYSNDDDAAREFERDSRLLFIPPQSGLYSIRVRDVRGFQGEQFPYTLTIRPAAPDFSVSVPTRDLKVPAGGGQVLRFVLARRDGFDEPVEIRIEHLPPGFTAAMPLVIPAGHLEASSVLMAAADAVTPSEAEWKAVRVTATGRQHGELVTREVSDLGAIAVAPPPTLRVQLQPDDPAATASDGGLLMAPGTTITALLTVDRQGFDGELRFEIENLPHGVIVDNIGLNGVMIRAGERERQIFLTSRPWVSDTTRLIHAVGQGQGNPVSPPLRLHIQRQQ